ncbi:SpoIIE family protein phosphatase [Verticiella sediminum]|uniref:SpoIIE family protein phosphatase n=1 Tax=Verticiella sediminum TaxID=1247510 RepID=A0A556A7V8_9BURK|nr:biofilm regulation protein phosphatase SiaA [Verticiella sediminum]TSH88972.1 SpoIIE family protein phosphatase [Verticiella sediminum]
MAHFSLRGKSLAALAFACLIVLVPAAVIVWLGVDRLREEFGSAHAQNLAILNQQHMMAPLSVELALSRQWAASAATRHWLRNESDPEAARLFFLEAETYRRAVHDQTYSISSLASGNYYFSDGDALADRQPRYVLSPTEPADAWFYDTLASNAEYNVNVNPDRILEISRVWINVPVRDEDGTPLGVAGSSINLTSFLDGLRGRDEDGVTPIVFDRMGAIQAHPDPALIAYNSGASGSDGEHTVYSLLDADGADAVRTAMQQAARDPSHAVELHAALHGERQHVALAYIPRLDWYAAVAVDPARWSGNAMRQWLWPALGALAATLLALLLIAALLAERLVLRPIRRLQTSARAVADGRYEVELPDASDDEIGDLGRAFGEMARRVRSHTEDLECRVRERTLALQQANDAMSAAQRQINASIDYASLIQRAILPDRQLTQFLGEQHFVMWRPRDVVGGDFYIFHQDGENCLLGLMDCAGHGVPGALMTMLARAAVDHAIHAAGPADPAGILARCDAVMRTMLADAHLPRALATNADAALVYIDRSAGRLVYAGARIDLYASDGADVQRHRAARRALMDRRQGAYTNLQLPLRPEWTYYLVTDGFLDQAGGERGWSFGDERFEALLRRNAGRPPAEQAEAFTRELAAYQGNNPQRDDITLLSFRFH